MRLINTKTLQLDEFLGKVPAYAILSHTWGKNETTLQEYQGRRGRHDSSGFRKIVAACRHARSQGLDWAWVDTCCIDKTSSSELGEAINSMYKWYQDAAVCYAFLEDVSANHHNSSEQSASSKTMPLATTTGVGLTNSRWFTRGWTLQELIAPRHVEFYDTEWNFIGEKQNMVPELRTITGIDTLVIQGGPLEQVSIAKRMSWASHRETRRPEDTAYSLLGIFGVNMPLLYGEGTKAFMRLQEQILRQSDDHTLFAWRATPVEGHKRQQVRGLFASEPSEFRNFFDGVKQRDSKHKEPHRPKDHLVRLWDSELPRDPMTLKNRGIRIRGQIQDLRPNFEQHDTVILLLNCCFGGNPGRTAGIYLRRQDENRYARIRPDELASVEPLGGHISQLTLYGLRHTDQVRGHHYDQPWTSSYKIRRELGDLDHSKFEDVEATKSRYENAFYIRADDLKPWTVFGRYKLHGVLMADSRGMLRFFRFHPETSYLDMVLKTYPGFHVVLLYKARSSSDLILVVLGRGASDHQNWVTATYLAGNQLGENSSKLLDTVGALTETTAASKEVSCRVVDDELRLWLSLTPGMVEGISMSELQIAGPWPADIPRSIVRLIKPGLTKGIAWIVITGLLVLAGIQSFDPNAIPELWFSEVATGK
ncbi:hypothetical protein FZEAL_1384 [Fusarium zealandicum]|uniref:Heterokaryon incompatibility domain-containing protein n=1 Tax=Fusarium zealandicum TaxID=1053134 RepID=A0A8H4UTK9_9HYPO|nr:hypothetical protein FZEAL_1384 [Fusarium zealandicum]